MEVKKLRCRMSQIQQKLTSSYLHVPNDEPCSDKTMGELFNERANSNPDKEMYVFYADKERKTYKQMQDESQQFARGLLKLGLMKGDTLGVWGGNHYEWLLAYIASFQIGVITVHMRMDFPLSVQQEMIKKIGIKVIVLMRSPEDLCDKACQIIPELAVNSAENLNCQGTPCLKYVINAGKTKCSGAYTLADFMELGEAVEKSDFFEACEQVDFDDPMTVLFTSGSTGFPKGVTHAHRLCSLLLDMYNTLSVDAEGNDVQWMSKFALPMSFGGVFAQDGAFMPILYPATTVFIGPTYDVQLLVNAIQDEKVTMIIMLIHHLNDVVNLPDFNEYDFSSLQICLSGGSIIPRSLRERVAKIANHILLGYGGTEGFMLNQRPKDPIEVLEDAAYPPLAGQECKILGPNEQIVPVDTPGEICMRGQSLFMYYWGEEEKTRAAKRPNGWYHTGDLGTMDENGYLKIVGRKAERIIKEGINIAPGDLEKVLDQHPKVNNVMVVSVPDERTSEEVCACVRLQSSAEVNADELKEFCRGKVSTFLVPKYILFMEDSFPTTETGKFDRKQIAAQAKSSLGL